MLPEAFSVFFDFSFNINTNNRFVTGNRLFDVIATDFCCTCFHHLTVPAISDKTY